MELPTLLLIGVTIAASSPTIPDFDKQLVDLVLSIKQTFNLENVFIFKKGSLDGPNNCELWNGPIVTMDRETDFELVTSYSRNSLAVVFLTNSSSDSILTSVDRALRGMHNIKTLFVFSGLETVRRFFKEWAFPRGFIYAKAVFPNFGVLNIIGYNPFFGFQLSNNTNTACEDLFPNPMKNLNKYTFRTPLLFDAPRIFKYRNAHNKVVRSGIGLYLLGNFIRSRRGKFREVPHLSSENQSVHMSDVFAAIDDGQVEIAANLYGFTNRSKYAASNGFVTKMCVMAPIIKPDKDRKVTVVVGGSWSAIFIALAEFVAIMALLTYGLLHSTSKKIHSPYGRAMLNAFALILNMSPPVSWPNDRRSVAICVPIMCACLVWSNIYYAVATSFLSHPREAKQIENVEDFIAFRQEILVPDYERHMFLANSNFPKEFEDLIIGMDVDTLTRYRLALNQTYAYGLSTERWRFLLYQQTYLNLPLFRVTSTCFFNYLLAFPMRYDSPFKEELNMYILEITERGFFRYWLDATIREASYANIVTRRQGGDSDDALQVQMEYSNTLWLLLKFGYLTSSIGFVVEWLVFIFKKK